jgi:hypothetical protein
VFLNQARCGTSKGNSPHLTFVLDGTERQIIKDVDGNMPRPKIRACNICDPFVLVLREDDSIGLFIGQTERGKIRRKDMSPMGDKASIVFFSRQK